MGEATKSEVMKAMSGIEQTKAMIKAAEIRLIDAQKMKEAAEALSSHHENSAGDCVEKHDGVTLSFEEYTALTCKVRETEEQSKKRVVDAMHLAS